MSDLSPAEFEEEVRRIARALWPSAEYGGPEMIADREVDGIFETEEVVHMVEATMDRKVQKIANVGPKLREHLKRHATHGRFAKSWFVTFHPPTADQRSAIRKYDSRIIAISYDEFRAKIVDGREYLRLRDMVGWGSAVNPRTNSQTDLIKYVPLSISVTSGTLSPGLRSRSERGASDGQETSIDELSAGLEAGRRIALLGDYGAGKSMTLREIHSRLRDKYRSSASPRFPITLSLRHHYGQEDPAEAITRHAAYLGFSAPHKLVSAWRSGYAYVLLDGFDELAAPGWSGSPDALRDNRREATILIKQFAKETPEGTGLIVAGRRFYFDSLSEMGRSLFDGQDHANAALSDFTDEQSKTFLEHFKEGGALPEWLPARPLLLGHLAAEGLIADVSDQTGLAPAPGWHWLLDRISERESFIKQGVDGPAVRKVIEQLASMARQTPEGVGPVTMRDIVEAFTVVRKQSPSDKEITLLQRLPGLGGALENAENGTRRFIDAGLASAAQAASVARFVADPYGEYLAFEPQKWTSSMDSLGIEVTAHQLFEAVTAGQLRAALKKAVRTDCYELAADIVRTAIVLDIDLPPDESGTKYDISNVVVPRLDIDEAGVDLSGVRFSQCVVAELFVSGEPGDEVPYFSHCSLMAVFGRLGEADMPPNRFQDCDFDEFPDAADRNSSILSSESLPIGTRVVMKLLRQLYMQRGSGRKDSALTRGMSGTDAALVGPAMQLLQRERLAFLTRQGTSRVWLPDRSAGPRVRSFLASPRVGDDPLIEGCKSLQGQK